MKKKDRIIISALTVWTFIHTYFLILNFNRDHISLSGQHKEFYPFTSSYGRSYFALKFYDYSEYFIYVVGAWVGFFIYRFLKGGK